MLKDVNDANIGELSADAERIEKQMRKTGNTPFEFENIDIELHGNLFVPMQSLNELRRNALEELEKQILHAYRRNEGIEPISKKISKENIRKKTAV